jgi:cAMP-dependent protein kinase regulator
MFSCLEEHEKKTVVGAMEERTFAAGEDVITQGDDGDVLYVVDKGELDCFKRFSEDQEPKHLKVYQPGESFGELALLYNAPRAATITAKTDSVLFALDRDTFNHIVKVS